MVSQNVLWQIPCILFVYQEVEILVEWRRSRVIYGKIDFFIVYYKSNIDHTYFKRKIEVGSKNSSDLYLVS